MFSENLSRSLDNPGRTLSLTIAAVATLTIGGALISEHVFGYLPCMLCLWQRWPYYVGILLALAVATGSVRGAPPSLLAVGFVLLALNFAIGAGLGAYHAGVEFSAWPGPASCGGGNASPTNAADMLAQMRGTRVVPCDRASLLILGLSLAVWNAVIAFGLWALSFAGIIMVRQKG